MAGTRTRSHVHPWAFGPVPPRGNEPLRAAGRGSSACRRPCSYSENLGRLADAARFFVDSVGPAEARRIVADEGGRWIDLREPEELASDARRLPGALMLRLPELRLLATSLLADRAQPLVVVDADGARGRLGAIALERLRYRCALHLRGGIASLEG